MAELVPNMNPPLEFLIAAFLIGCAVAWYAGVGHELVKKHFRSKAFWQGFREGLALGGEAILMPWRIPNVIRKLRGK